MDISFVSYDGVCPNLCRGTLTLSINGSERKFGYGDGFEERFWVSGGSCGFSSDWSESYVRCGDWIVDEYDLPDDLKPYADEIADIMNENIEHGCCGGCL